MEQPSCDPSAVSPRRVMHDKANLLPDVEVVDGVTTLSDRGRYQVLVFVDNTTLYCEHHSSRYNICFTAITTFDYCLIGEFF